MTSPTNTEVEIKSLENFCRGCLIQFEESSQLIQYTEKTRRQFIYATGLQVKRDDTFTFQLCKECYVNIKMTCKFKKQCRTSDKRYRNYLALKEAGETADFCSFLKKTDDSFRFPFMNGYSTPMHQKSKDDDNESTTTSIRNFMTDMLKDEQLPETEVNIIRETIEEQADILDDSLDSQWLQEDMSIDIDFPLDFSPFATPRSVVNDSPKRGGRGHVYMPTSFSPFMTPRSTVNETRQLVNAPPLPIVSGQIPFKTPKPQDEAPNNFVPTKKILQIQDKTEVIVGEPLVPDTIDKNLEKALKADINEFALEDLLISPANNQAATPTIREILFGGKALKCDDDSQTNILPKVGHNIETYEDVKGEVELENMFKSAKLNFYGCADLGMEYLDVPTPSEVSQNDMDSLRQHSEPKKKPAENVLHTDVLKKREEKEMVQPQTGLVDECQITLKEEKIFYCEACQLDTENYTKTIEHFREFHTFKSSAVKKKRTRICEHCGKPFTVLRRFLLHVREHKKADHPEKYICDICCRTFTVKSKIIIHMKTHMKQTGSTKAPTDYKTKMMFVCPICNTRSTDSSNFKLHMRRHEKKYSVFCDQCKKGFIRKQDLKYHMRLHGEPEIIFTCPHCQGEFYRKDTFHQHLSSKHSGEKPFECEFCHIKFCKNSHLNRHLKTSQTCKKIRESGILLTDTNRVFECEHCHATFANPGHLTMHVRRNRNCLLLRAGYVERKKRKYRKKRNCLAD